jgi:hypothetical protein
LGIKAVRVGPSSKVQEDLQQATVDYLVQNHDESKHIQELKEKTLEMSGNFRTLKGDDLLMAKRDVTRVSHVRSAMMNSSQVLFLLRGDVSFCRIGSE